MSEARRYQLHLTENAERQIARLERRIARLVMKKLFALTASVETARHFALKGEFKGLYRLRVGDYRVIYDLDHDALLVVVVAVRHRSDAYDE